MHQHTRKVKRRVDGKRRWVNVRRTRCVRRVSAPKSVKPKSIKR